MKSKKILISLFTAGILSSTAFAKTDQKNQQIDSYSYVLQNIQQVHKDFLGISIADNNSYQGSLKRLTPEFLGQKQFALLSSLPFSNPIFNSSNGGGAQLAVKSVSFERNTISEILSETSKELPELPLQLASSPNLRGFLVQALRSLPSQAGLLMDSDVINHSDQGKGRDKGSLFSQSANLLMKLTTNSDEAAIQKIDSIQPQSVGSHPQLATDFDVEDLLNHTVGGTQPQLVGSLPQLTMSSEIEGFSEPTIEITQPQSVGSLPQLTMNSDMESFSEPAIEVTQSAPRPQLTVHSDIESFSSQREENVPQATTIRRAPPMPPSMLLKSNPNLGESKTRAGFSFDAVLQQLKGHMNGSGLRSTDTTLKGKDKGMEISLGQMGTISGKEAQKFADRWAKLREAAEANSKESVAGKGDTKPQKVETAKPKVVPLRRAVSEKALRLQKKATNTASLGSLADQLQQAKLNKVAADKANNTINPFVKTPDLNGDLIRELKRSKSLNHIDVLAIRHAPQEVTVTIEDLEAKLASTKDLFFRKQIQRQINDMKAELLPKVEDKPVVIEATSAPVTLLSLPLDNNSGQDKKDEPSVSLPIVVKAPLVQEEAKVIQIGGFSINVTMLNKFAQEDDAEDDNSGDWDEEDSKPLVTEKLIVNQEPTTAEELVIKTVAPKVGKLNIKASTGGDLLAQIRAARAKIEAVETDGAKIQATLDLEKIRADKLKQEAQERELEKRQAAKLQTNKKPDADLGDFLTGALTKRREAMNQVEDEDDEW